ncbi:Ku protein [Streptomyces sp. NPDC002589]|uniref:Ku protein n=1 Tax=Streptomyces sp. NPDC002589 TaxID=3154420 RepID=UPI00332CAC85
MHRTEHGHGSGDMDRGGDIRIGELSGRAVHGHRRPHPPLPPAPAGHLRPDPQPASERTGDEVNTGDIVKGYEIDEGEYIVVDPEELDDIAPGRSQTIDISDFIDLGQIEPVYFDRTYYLAEPPTTTSAACGSCLPAASTRPRP